MSESPPGDPKTPPPGTNIRIFPTAERNHASPPSFPVVGIGASAGGLDACRKLVQTLPSDNGMAFILVQHLDPTYQSMMVDLLAGHTAMPVQQATEGMVVERDHLYIIPPGAYLSIAKGVLHLSAPQERHGARMPFDFLLASLARDCGPNAICVVLSGTGADGSVGLRAVKAAGGLVIAQDPRDAEYDGMPQSAIMTGMVDWIVPAGDIAAALVKHVQHPETEPKITHPHVRQVDCMPTIIALLRTHTDQDFSLYKPGTLQRRIERRMAISGIAITDMHHYLDLLQNDNAELEQLGKDLLINVTNFFRDPKVFQFLEEKIIPDIVYNHPQERPLRIWIAGCSTGEEAYSLAMIFREQIIARRSRLKLQIFASDVDAEAIDTAREGLYPAAIKADVSASRLKHFFSKEGNSYRVLPELRSSVVFTVQDVLADPPFSRLDFISCRNLLIYLSREAQEKVITIFHFALREGGLLLLGSAETITNEGTKFEVLSKPERLYRHIGKSRPGDLDFFASRGDYPRIPATAGQPPALTRETAFAEVCRRLVMESFAPATVLINLKREVVYSIGPTNRYLTIPPGSPTHDLLAMAREGLHSKINAALRKVERDKARAVVPGSTLHIDGKEFSVTLDVQPIRCGGEDLLLICFIDQLLPGKAQIRPTAKDAPRVAELERELDAKKAELREAIRDLEISTEDQRTVNEEALSVNEEYQSTNEELVTSKEELQSLNEELTALNVQLQETLERQRTTADDLQNVLYSTNVATLFLDTKLNIRFFTPATKLLFNVIPTDIGRPLADLNSLSADTLLPADAHAVLRDLSPIEREIEAKDGMWFSRRILPYRTHDNRVEGVVITFTDITERKSVRAALEDAKQQADQSNLAKSHFLAVASHDLRQPLQTLSLLQGLLAKLVEGEKAKKLVTRLDETLAAISSMLNTLLDINQIDAGTVHAEMVDFPINELLDRLSDEFAYHAQAKGLEFRVVSCSATIHSDPRLLEQMIRNLLSNAFKYTKHGKVLLGCRRRGAILCIEILDTGIGIPASEYQAIFKEYHQLDNAARERSRGLGLGLSIVQRLGNLLGHHVWVTSLPHKGSVFGIDITLPAGEKPSPRPTPFLVVGQPAAPLPPTGAILVVEDDPDVRELLEQILTEDGHRVTSAEDAISALEMVERQDLHPNLLLTDYNLPGGMNGIELMAQLREHLHANIPGIILTGDISTGTLRDIAAMKCIRLNKPVKLLELADVINRLLPISQSLPGTSTPAATRIAPPPTPPVTVAPPTPSPGAKPHPGQTTVFVVDDDAHVRDSIRIVLEDDGKLVEEHGTCEEFLAAYHPGEDACLLIDAYLPGMNGLELLKHLRAAGHHLPAIMITGNSDVPMAVEAMKAGASDFIEKPVSRTALLAAIERTLEQTHDHQKLDAWRAEAAGHVAGLTSRQREVMTMVLAGHPSKNIAADLGISQRTVENHRASIMKKTGAKSLPALARLALAATWADGEEPTI